MCNRFHTLNDFLDHLRWVLDQKEQKERAGDGSYYYMMSCPVHGGKSRDLKIEAIDLKVFIHCFAGCEQKYILDALNLRPEDLFFEGTGFQNRTVETPSFIYNFIDDDGDLLHQIVCYKPKKSGQHRL